MKTPTQTYIEAIRKICPSDTELQALCTAVHAAMVDADVSELLWMSINFEDLGDAITTAVEVSHTDRPSLQDLADLADWRRRDARDREAEKHFEGVTA